MKRSSIPARVNRLRPPAPRPGEPHAVLTSDERRRRAATLILKARLGRPPTQDDLATFEHGGGIAASITPAFCDRRVAEAEKSGDARGAERWHSIAAGLDRLRTARRAA